MATFSDRHGYTPVKKLILREDVPIHMRLALWNMLNISIWKQWRFYDYGWTAESDRINALLKRIWLHFLKRDWDDLPEFRYRPGYGPGKGGYDVLKDYFFKCKWFEVFNFIEFLAKDQSDLFSPKLVNWLNSVLEHENSAYRLVGKEVAEITAEVQIAAIQNALEVNAPPVREHLSAALALLSDKASPDYRNSIKESISAVEAACRDVASSPKATLSDALKKVSGLHPAMSKAFSNLYGYTNDADGIRHALLEESGLTKDDALFMLVACSAFVGFLYTKGKS